MVKFELNDEQAQRLEQAMAQLPGESEQVVNRVLKDHGTTEMIQSIVDFMPMSKTSNKHAKTSNPLQSKMFNLGFEIKPKARFGYLVFPDQGLGNKNPMAQQFFERGAKDANERILQQLEKTLIDLNNEKMGGI